MRITVVPRRRAMEAAARKASRGVSSWASRTSAAAMAELQLSTMAGVREWLAPGATAIWFSPRSSTTIRAAPVGRSTSASPAVSTPSAASNRRAAAPNSSFPTAPMKLTSAPRRRAATAWLDPLPPGPRWKDRPRTVCPRSGSRGAATTRSMLNEPSTAIDGMRPGYVIGSPRSERGCRFLSYPSCMMNRCRTTQNARCPDRRFIRQGTPASGRLQPAVVCGEGLPLFRGGCGCVLTPPLHRDRE